MLNFISFKCVLTIACIFPLFIKEVVSLYRQVKNKSQKSYRQLDSSNVDEADED